MDLLSSLGIDYTIVYQLGIFLVGYAILYNLVFKPYVAAHNKRLERTVGGLESNDRVLADIQHLKKHHEDKSREINQEYKLIYDEKRSEALVEFDKITAKARETAKEQIERTRSLIKLEIDKSKKIIEKEVPEISKTLVTKLLK